MFLIGADPEVFVVNKKTNKIVPGIGLIGGNKLSPRQVDRGALQEDNVMAEFNIDPAQDSFTFRRNIKEVLRQLDVTLEKTGHEYDKSFRTSHQFSLDELKDPQAQRFGCDPDFNAYTLEENETIKPDKIGKVRMCGGHIHIGMPSPDAHPMTRIMTARWMDILVGAPLSRLDPDITRRQFYGKAGNFRVKEYGIEYRTPSNFWLSSDNLMKFVFENSLLAATRGNSREPISIYDAGGRYTPELIREIIDLSDNKEELVRMLARFRVIMPNAK